MYRGIHFAIVLAIKRGLNTEKENKPAEWHKLQIFLEFSQSGFNLSSHAVYSTSTGDWHYIHPAYKYILPHTASCHKNTLTKYTRCTHISPLGISFIDSVLFLIIIRSSLILYSFDFVHELLSLYSVDEGLRGQRSYNQVVILLCMYVRMYELQIICLIRCSHYQRTPTGLYCKSCAMHGPCYS